jgi:predicted DNA-binding transcriptional regulator AlpA
MELRKHPGLTDKELMKMSGIKKGTFYRYKKVLQGKGLI